jgi:DNA-binding IclR family transcriptional regulator
MPIEAAREQRHMDQTKKTERESAGVKSLLLALDALEQIAAAEAELGVTDLANKLGVAKGSIFRHLKTLAERGYLLQNAETGRYRLGPRARLLGQLAGEDTDLLSASQDIMRGLSEQTGQTAVISAVIVDRLIVLATRLAKSPVEIGVRPGSTLSLHASAQGKVALAFSKHLSLAHLGKRPLPRLTNRTVASWKSLADEIELVSQRGWATAPEEVYLGINGLAAPIFDASGDCIGTVALVGLLQHIPRDPHSYQVDAVLKAATTVSSRLGYHAPSPMHRGTPLKSARTKYRHQRPTTRD